MTKPMTVSVLLRFTTIATLALVIALGLAGAAAAQPAADAPAAAAGAAPAAPAAAAAGDARAQCVAAMNADPKFAASIVKTADEAAAIQRDKDTLAAHQDAYAHIQKNERHVIFAYAALWLIAGGFVLWMWRRQVALRTEIAALRRELEAAGGKP